MIQKDLKKREKKINSVIKNFNFDELDEEYNSIKFYILKTVDFFYQYVIII